MHNKIKKAEYEIEQRQQEKEKLGEFKAIVTHLKLEKESLECEVSDLKTKIKKAEIDYEQKRLAMQELQDVRDVLTYLKPERDSLKSEISQLRDKIQKIEEAFDEVNSKKRQCQLEYDDLKFQLKRLETENSEKRNSFSHFTR
jgi:chromosome segregation ATPase